MKLEQDWGSDRRLASKRLFTAAGDDVWHVSYGYDGDDNITSITDHVTPANSRSFGYDSVDRLNRVDGGTSGFAREDYVHDKNGNLLGVERRVNVGDSSPAQSDVHAIASGTNRLTSVVHAAGTRSFTHDARGNLTADTRPAGAGVTLGYDGHARLASYARAGAETQAMLYNGFDERVGVTTLLGGSAVEERRFAYDAGHRIVGEYGATGADLRAEYIWLLPEVGEGSAFGGDDGLGGYMPLAVAVPDGAASKLHWVQGNHLGTPAVTTDASGAMVAPSGYARIGFPGQVEQHADLYYNYYRDYDPTLGRYAQADPIGLDGDINPYVYAQANPLAGGDPNGLQAISIQVPRVPVRRPGLSPTGRNPLAEGGYTRPRPLPSPQKSVPIPRETFIGRPGRMPTRQEVLLRQAQNIERSGRCYYGPLPAGIGSTWTQNPTRSLGGISYTDPISGAEIRFMPGNPNSRWPNSQKPYVRWDANGDARDIRGRSVPRESPEAHIPTREWMKDIRK